MTNENTPTLFDIPSGNSAGASDDKIVDLTRAERGRQMYASCDQWTAENDGAASYVEEAVLEAIRHGRKVSVREKLERVRWGDFTDQYGKPTRASNNLSAPLARRIIQRHPEAKDHIITRPSACDEFDRLVAGELA